MMVLFFLRGSSHSVVEYCGSQGVEPMDGQMGQARAKKRKEDKAVLTLLSRRWLRTIGKVDNLRLLLFLAPPRASAVRLSRRRIVIPQAKMRNPLSTRHNEMTYWD
jgi:hypothetical protein